ncbi:amidohydrolase family protein [Haladaptatus pallidirubidus]|uniref:amidohydrolase family protein n=1 Tax=Haladaptatus pallidirubidus TaxID=1008152 RepID=UPI00406BD2AC
MRIDVHNHLLPEPYVDLLLEWDTPVGLESKGDRLYMIHQRSGTVSVAEGNQIPVNEGFTDVDARFEWMNQYDVERTLVSVSTPNPIDEAFTPEQSTELIRTINDGFADLQSQHPDRIAGLGMLPLREPEEAVTEVDRIVDDLNLHGIALPTSVNGRKLSRSELVPVFDRIDDTRLTAFVHPHGNVLSDELGADESFFNPLIVFPTETTFQIARLIYDGFFDDHDFDVVLSHMGGALLQLVGRLEQGRDEIDDPASRPDRPIREYLRGSTTTAYPSTVPRSLPTLTPSESTNSCSEPTSRSTRRTPKSSSPMSRRPLSPRLTWNGSCTRMLPNSSTYDLDMMFLFPKFLRSAF